MEKKKSATAEPGDLSIITMLQLQVPAGKNDNTAGEGEWEQDLKSAGCRYEGKNFSDLTRRWKIDANTILP